MSSRAYVPSAFDLFISGRHSFEKGDRFMFCYGDGILIPTTEFQKLDSIQWVKRLEFATRLYEPLKHISDVINAGNYWDSNSSIQAYNRFINFSGYYYATIGYEPLADVIEGLWHGGEIPPEYCSGNSQQKANPRVPSPGYLYLVQAVTPDSHYKIGLSKDPVTRIDSMGVKLPFPIEPIHTFETDDMFLCEKFLHNKYDSHRVNGEWFELSEQDVADICAIQSLNAEDIAS